MMPVSDYLALHYPEALRPLSVGITATLEEVRMLLLCKSQRGVHTESIQSQSRVTRVTERSYRVK
jgi:hypothetical protein